MSLAEERVQWSTCVIAVLDLRVLKSQICTVCVLFSFAVLSTAAVTGGTGYADLRDKTAILAAAINDKLCIWPLVAHWLFRP
jgi:hypothetical protein